MLGPGLAVSPDQGGGEAGAVPTTSSTQQGEVFQENMQGLRDLLGHLGQSELKVSVTCGAGGAPVLILARPF